MKFIIRLKLGHGVLNVNMGSEVHMAQAKEILKHSKTRSLT